jgi:hypothetical protein
MKIKGDELTQFIKEGWPDENYYWETEAFETTPNYLPLPDVTYDTEELSDLFWQGDEPDPTGGEGLRLESAIKNWRKKRDSRVLSIRVPNSVSDAEIREALRALKGKIEK